MLSLVRVRAALRREFADADRWWARAVVIAYAALAGLSVVAFTWLSERALATFATAQSQVAWLPLLWTPLATVAVVWATQRFAPGAAGSGIPQVMAALDPAVAPEHRGLFVSLRLSLAKVGLTAGSLLAGLSVGREGPSVQVAAGVMHHARRWLPRRAAVTDRGLLVAGGAAGVAAAFNTPLGGVMFAIEQLASAPEQRSNGLLVTAIVLAGLIAVSAYGDSAYFGVIRPQPATLALLLPALLVAVAAGLAGGLFARLLIVSLDGRGADRFSRWRRQRPLAFAGACGLAVAALGLATGGATFGSGYAHTQSILAAEAPQASAYVPLKFVATWLSIWSGAPGGVFAPSLAIGAALGNDVAAWTGYGHAPTLIALGMAGFLAAATRAPLTAFIVVMEMVDGHRMVLSLMACALVADGVARVVSRPLYAALAQRQLARLPGR